MSDADIRYSEIPGYTSRSVNPTKLAYRGVLIERPCVNCDTVDVHFDGECNSGPCADCGKDRYVSTMRFGYIESHGYGDDHKWTPNTYYPDDIEEPECNCTGHWSHIPGNPTCPRTSWRGFDRIVDKARELGLPELYTSDLFRDYQHITGRGQTWQGQPPVLRFVWALRRNGCGTDLFTPEVGISSYHDDSPHMAYFLYDGITHGPLGDFVECNLDTARTVLSAWRGYDLKPVQSIDDMQGERDAALLGMNIPEPS